MEKATPSVQRKTSSGSGLLSDWKPLLVALAVTVALEILGGWLLPKREDPLYGILVIVDAAVIALFYLANFLFYRRLEYLYNKRKLSEIHETLLKKQQSVEADYRQALLRLRKSIHFARTWYVLMMVLVCSAAFLIIPASLPIPFVLMVCYLLWGLLCIWFRKEEDTTPRLELSERDYPTIHQLVCQAAKTAGSTMPVRMCAGGESIGILRKPKEIWIMLDAVTCALYTKQELYNVLLHEFAHEINEDTVETMRAGQALERWAGLPEGVLTRIGGYLLTLPACVISLEYIFYELFATKHREELADACAMRWGNAQELVNSLAKGSVWRFFENSSQVPELTMYSECAEETPPVDLPARALRAFRRMLPEKRGEWRRRLEVELPPRIRSHPIFRERREAFGVVEYSFETEETDPAYLSETEAMLALTGKAIAERMAETYEEDRQYYYFERKALIDRAKAMTDWSACTIDERIEMARALAVLEPELEETAIWSILQDDPENAYGFMLLGSKRYRENDPACVELLRQAADRNHNFVEDAYEKIGEYALRNGDEALLETYRDEVTDAVQTARDTSDSLALGWKRQEKLSGNDLAKDRFEENLEAILERTEGRLTGLYSVKKAVVGGPCYYYFLEFPPALDEEERTRLQHQVFLYLDYCEEQYYLEDLTDQPKKRDYLLRRVPGCELLQKGRTE